MLFNQSTTGQLHMGQSVGAANQLFSNLVQTILAVQLSLSPPEMWPLDYGEVAKQYGTI